MSYNCTIYRFGVDGNGIRYGIVEYKCTTIAGNIAVIVFYNDA